MSSFDVEKCQELRKRIFITGYKGGMAHLASCFSAIDIIYALYMKGILNHNPSNPNMVDRDRFVLSKGHAGLALYSVLCEAGYISKEELSTYLKPYCRIGGEPNMRDLPGIEASTGSLGHGLSNAVGMAMAQKCDNNGAKTYVMIGDGESQEGTIWEAAMVAVKFSLDNLIVILDCNELQKTKRVQETMNYVHWDEKWKAFGWNVAEMDGHNIENIVDTLKNIDYNGRPTLVIAHTVKGEGVSIMEGSPIWHFKLPNRKEKKVFMEELNISEKELEE